MQKLERRILYLVQDLDDWTNPNKVKYYCDGGDRCLLTCVHPYDVTGRILIYLDSLTPQQLIDQFHLQNVRQFKAIKAAQLLEIFESREGARLFTCVDNSYDSLEFRWQEGQLHAYDVEKELGTFLYLRANLHQLLSYTDQYFKTLTNDLIK